MLKSSQFVAVVLGCASVICLVNSIPAGGELLFDTLTTGPNCTWRHNITDEDLIHAEKQEALENCIYYYLVAEDMRTSGDTYTLFLKPPWEEPVIINVDQLSIEQVDLIDKKSNEFHIRGNMYISWKDERLKWNKTEWLVESFLLHDHHHVWAPMFTDESRCSPLEGCVSSVDDIEVSFDGKVSATVTFRYPSYCGINFYHYPEETNDCCLFLSVFETERRLEFKIDTKAKENVNKNVALTEIENRPTKTVLKNVETTMWKVEDRTIEIVKAGGIRSQFLRICIHARKDMATLKVALRIPATIATLLMLASPLFGDLKTQIFAKLVVLILQTICFLFLCSIAPENGFGGLKPKLYSFYEFLFLNSAFSITITLICMALCRVKRTTAPIHNLYLVSKVINRFVCCIEPDQAVAYTRYIDEPQENGLDTEQRQPANVCNDYTVEWRHVYIAANNLFAAISFSIFVFVILFDII